MKRFRFKNGIKVVHYPRLLRLDRSTTLGELTDELRKVRKEIGHSKSSIVKLELTLSEFDFLASVFTVYDINPIVDVSVEKTSCL